MSSFLYYDLGGGNGEDDKKGDDQSWSLHLIVSYVYPRESSVSTDGQKTISVEHQIKKDQKPETFGDVMERLKPHKY